VTILKQPTFKAPFLFDSQNVLIAEKMTQILFSIYFNSKNGQPILD
jgi:hypothetical protein